MNKKVTSITAGQKRLRQRIKAEDVLENRKPGIITSIMQELVNARDRDKMITVEQIVEKLDRKFGDNHETEGLAVTVRAQLSRLPREKQFGIVKQRDGRVVRYAAA